MKTKLTIKEIKRAVISCEILIFLLCALAGVSIYIFTWLGFFCGIAIFCLTSHFLVTRLKELTLMWYIKTRKVKK